MASIHQLNTLIKQLRGGDNSRTTSQISLPNSDMNAKATLDKYYSNCVAATKTSISQPNSNNSNGNTSKNNSQVSQALDSVIDLSAVTNQRAMKVVKMAMYYSSPLRLMLKAHLLRQTAQEKYEFLQKVSLRNEIKNEIMNPWNNYDSFGLRILTKIYRRYEMQRTGQQVPEGYLFWVVFGHPTQEILQVVDRHLLWVASDEERDVFSQDAREDLQKKIARELNNYAAFALDRRVRIQMDGQEQVYDPKMLIQQIHQKLAESYTDIANLMNVWSSADTDVSMEIGPVITAYGGKENKKKKPIRKVKK